MHNSWPKLMKCWGLEQLEKPENLKKLNLEPGRWDRLHHSVFSVRYSVFLAVC
jgi:hypothetical protein